MTTKKRDTVTYKLERGRKTEYIGETNHPARREQEHKEEGKKFDRLVPTSRHMTKKGAQQKEQQQLETYRKNHGGKNPKYNKE